MLCELVINCNTMPDVPKREDGREGQKIEKLSEDLNSGLCYLLTDLGFVLFVCLLRFFNAMTPDIYQTNKSKRQKLTSLG